MRVWEVGVAFAWKGDDGDVLDDEEDDDEYDDESDESDESDGAVERRMVEDYDADGWMDLEAFEVGT